MSQLPTSQIRVLAIDPSTQGFGFAVLEGPDRLIDWGVKSARRNKNAQCLAKIVELIEFYRPNLIAVENHSAKDSRRCERMRRLINSIVELAGKRKVKTRRFSRRQVRKTFSDFGAVTKHEIATAIARRFHELAPHLPLYRKPWMSEDCWMSVFNAVAMGLTIYVNT